MGNELIRYAWVGIVGGLLMAAGGLMLTVLLWRSQRPTEEELARRAFIRETAARQKQIRKVARQLRPEIIRGLVQQGFTFIYERQGAVAKSSNPVIRLILCTNDAVYFKISRLPFRVSPFDLMPPEVAKNLSVQVGRECKIIVDTNLGIWVQVGLQSGVGDIPKFFPWHDTADPGNAVELLPKTKTFHIALGVGEGRKFIHEDLRDLPHLIVAGATGGGKSVFLNQMLCSLLSRNPPERLQLVMIDLKGGLEFWDYRDVPHLRYPVVIEREDIPPILELVMAEKAKRFNMLRNAGVKNISGWNSNRSEKLPYIVLVFDEIAALMQDTKIKKQTEALIEDLAAQGRAVGIHGVFCTQIPTADVLSKILRGNIVTRVAFAMNMTGSILTVDSGRAAELPAKTGRMIYKRSLDWVELQAPFISDAQIKQTIADIPTVAAPEPAKFTPDDVFRLAIENGGKFTDRALLAQTGGQHVEIVRSTNRGFDFDYKQQGPVVEVDGGRYVVGTVKMVGGRGRVLLPVNGHLPASADEFAEMWAERKQQRAIIAPAPVEGA